MTLRPMITRCRGWVERTARLSALGLLMTGPLASAQTLGPGVYRCGSTYSSTPCPGGNAVDTDDARSAAQQREAQEVKRRDAALAEQLAGERRAREREAASQPAVGIGPTAVADAPRRDTSALKTTTQTTKKKKKKSGTQKPQTTQPQKLSSAR